MPAPAYPAPKRTQKRAQRAGRGTGHDRSCVPGCADNAGKCTTGQQGRRLCPCLRTRLSSVRRKVRNQRVGMPFMPVPAYPARLTTQKGARRVGGAGDHARFCVHGSVADAEKCTTCVAAGVFATADAAVVGDMAAKTLRAFTAVFVRLICNRLQKRTMCKQKCPP